MLWHHLLSCSELLPSSILICLALFLEFFFCSTFPVCQGHIAFIIKDLINFNISEYESLFLSFPVLEYSWIVSLGFLHIVFTCSLSSSNINLKRKTLLEFFTWITLHFFNYLEDHWQLCHVGSSSSKNLAMDWLSTGLSLLWHHSVTMFSLCTRLEHCLLSSLQFYTSFL